MEWNGSRYIKAHSEEAYPYMSGEPRMEKASKGIPWILTKMNSPLQDKKLPNIYESSSNAWKTSGLETEPEQE
jgi:hypothetical protein